MGLQPSTEAQWTVTTVTVCAMVLERASEWRQGRLAASEYDETTWAARKFIPFAAQRISVAVHLSLAQEVAEALGLAVACDPRA